MKIKYAILSLIAAAIMFSCSTSNNVVGGGLIQKRKYNDGYYISWNKKYSKSNDEQIAKNDTQVESEKISDSDEKIEPIISENQETNSENLAQSNEPISVETEAKPNVDETIVTADNSNENLSSKSTESENETTTENVSRNKPVKQIQTVLKSNSSSSSADVMLIICIILCFFIPPLAVGIFEGITGRFWIDLILFLVGIGVGWWLFGGGLAYLCALIAVIYALLIVLSVI